MSIRRHTLYNLAGAVVPLASTIVVVPYYLHAVGEPRYGVIALVWLLFGYFGLFDLGLSTATANALAKLRGGSQSDRGSVLATSLIVNAGLGSVIGLLTVLLGSTLLSHVSLDPGLRDELTAALPWLAVLCPCVTAGGVFNGVLTAHDRFLSINLLGTVGTLLTQAVPLLAAWYVGPSLSVTIPATVIVRAGMIAVTVWLASRDVSVRSGRFDAERLRELLSFGGWVMVTNLISPLLVSADQFVIASLLGPAAVARYSIAFSLAVRLLIIPTAFVQTAFPVLSRLDGDEARALAERGVRTMLLIMTTVSVPLILLAGPFLHWWLGDAAGYAAAPVARILLISTWINGLAFIPFTLLQAQGRPHRVAMFHLMEVVPFLVALFAGIHYLGLIGAALAWAFRVAIDALLLFGAARLARGSGLRLTAAAALVCGACVVAQFAGLPALYALCVALATGSALAVGSVVLDPLLRQWAGTLLRQLRPRP